MTIYKKLIIFCLLTTISACLGRNKVIDIKSPCVSTEDGPCGPRKPVNVWLNQNINL